jgi:hypothetical protein
MKWICSYRDKYGKMCGRQAVWRLHFSPDHPFDHLDVCHEHSMSYQHVSWLQDITDYGKREERKNER